MITTPSLPNQPALINRWPFTLDLIQNLVLLVGDILVYHNYANFLVNDSNDHSYSVRPNQQSMGISTLQFTVHFFSDTVTSIDVGQFWASNLFEWRHEGILVVYIIMWIPTLVFTAKLSSLFVPNPIYMCILIPMLWYFTVYNPL